MPPLTQKQWKTVKKLAGTVSDGDLARQMNCSRQLIQMYRKKYNIPALYKKTTKEERNKLCGVAGSVSTREISEVTGIPLYSVNKYIKDNNICRQNTQASDGAKHHYCSLEDLQSKLKQYAGTDTDSKVAQLCGCSKATVFVYRKKNNIKRYMHSGRTRLTTEQKEQLLSMLKDPNNTIGHIAIMVGCSESTVNYYRNKPNSQ